MYPVISGVTERVLSVLGLGRRQRQMNDVLHYSDHDIDVSKKPVLMTYSKLTLPSHYTNNLFYTTLSMTTTVSLAPSSSQSSLMESVLCGELQLPAELIINNSHHLILKSSKTGSFASLPLSDSDGEESGYMSCTSSEQKARGSKDIESLLANHSDSSNGSLNDLSSCDQNDPHDQIQEEDELVHVDNMTSTFLTSSLSSTDVASKSTGVVMSIHVVMTSKQVEETNEEDIEESSDDENMETDGCHDDDDDEEEEEEEDEEDGGDHDQNDDDLRASDSDEDGDEEDEDEETVTRIIWDKSYMRQTTVIEGKQDYSDEESDDDDDDDNDDNDEDFSSFPEKKKKKSPPKRMPSTESEGTWVSDSDEKCVEGNKIVNDDNSVGLDVCDFFEGLGDGITYSFHDADTGDINVQTYPSKEFFRNERSSPIYGLETDIEKEDDDDEFTYLYSNDLKTGKRYAFPRKEPRTITDAINFWETDFEVKGSIYPCMASWESKSLAPYEEDVEDFDKFNMYKSLYEKWVKCNRSREQWSQRYWGRSMETVAKMKGPPKMVTSQSDSAIDYMYTISGTCVSSPDLTMAERQRQRCNDSVQATRGCY